MEKSKTTCPHWAMHSSPHEVLFGQSATPMLRGTWDTNPSNRKFPFFFHTGSCIRHLQGIVYWARCSGHTVLYFHNVGFVDPFTLPVASSSAGNTLPCFSFRRAPAGKETNSCFILIITRSMVALVFGVPHTFRAPA